MMTTFKRFMAISGCIVLVLQYASYLGIVADPIVGTVLPVVELALGTISAVMDLTQLWQDWKRR